MIERDIFIAALQKEAPAERQAYLEEACRGDTALRRGVQVLLDAHERAGSFLERPAPDPVATRDEPVGERPGTMVGPYRLMEQVGEGGMGLVFVAEQQQPVRRKVALKVLKPGMDSKQVVARFEAERQALALMDHPHIARVFDAGTTPAGRPYFVMELVKGLPITDYCDQNGLPVRERLGLFVDVCGAVQHAHQKGVIHRDLKPSNVLVVSHDGTPVAKVIDFGIAKAVGQRLTDKTVYTQLAQLIGTPLYMSPEQAGQSGLDVDTRSDIYSLGVLLYELLTGTTPFDPERLRAAGYDELRRIIREEEPPRPSTRISTLGQAAATASAQRRSDPRQLSRLCRGELDWIVMKALEKDRNRRYESASAFAADVRRYLDDEPVLACPPSAWYRLRKLVRRRKTALAMAACAFLALAGVTGSIGWTVRDKRAREEEVAREQAARDGQAAHDREVREVALDGVVGRILDEAGPLIGQGKWPEALAAVERADQLLAAAGRAERPPRLLGLHKDLSLVRRLEEINRAPEPAPASLVIAAGPPGQPGILARQVAAEEEFFMGREQDPRFAAAFRDFDIDLDALPAAEAAARISRSPVRPALVQALDEWAVLRRKARGNADAGWKKLVEVARRADGDAWRNRFRDASLRRDRPTLEQLAAAVPFREVPPATLWLLGEELMDLGAKDRALAVLRQAQHQYPDDAHINDVLGWYSWKACQPPRYEDALRYYMIASALRPRLARGHQSVAQVLRDQGALEEAKAEYARVFELAPEDAGAHIDLGNALWDKRRLEEAIAEFREAARLRKDYPLAHYNLGFVLRKKGQPDEAIAEFRETLRIQNDYPEAHINLGFALFDKGRLDEAIAEYREALRLKKDYALAHFNLGVALHYKGRPDEAIAEYTMANELDPEHPDTLNDLAWALATHPDAKVRNPRQAVALAKKAVQLAPHEGGFWNTLGVAQYRAGDPQAAVAALTKAMEVRQGSVVNDWFFLAMAHQKLGNAAEARKEYDRAVAWMENHSPALKKDARQAEELRRFRSEAEEVLQLKK